MKQIVALGLTELTIKVLQKGMTLSKNKPQHEQESA
jgi:hypothetical protein